VGERPGLICTALAFAGRKEAAKASKSGVSRVCSRALRPPEAEAGEREREREGEGEGLAKGERALMEPRGDGSRMFARLGLAGLANNIMRPPH